MDGGQLPRNIDFRMNGWGVDVAISGPQKGFMLPTGLAILCVSQKALGEGVYHINAVDCVTRGKIMATCERLSEAKTARGCA